MKKLLLFMFLTTCFLGSSQVRLVKDFVSGSGSSNAYPLFVAGGRLYVSALQSSGSSTAKIYKSDGTNAGTVNVSSGASSTCNTLDLTITKDEFSVINDVAYFEGIYFDGANPGFPALLRTNSNGDAEFLCGQYSSGSQFWDGTIKQPSKLGDKVFFGARNNNYVFELFYADLLNTSNSGLFLEIFVGGSGYSNPLHFTSFNGGLIFAATNGTLGRELWFTDGTTTGTNNFIDINSGSANSDPDQLSGISGQIIFVATHPTLGRELFKVNTSGTLTLVKDINPSGDSNITNMANIGGTLYFSADNGSIGQELWKSNGFGTGTVLLKDINPTGASNPSKFTQVGSTIFFIANDGVNGIELWKTDGTAAGTVMVKNINPSGNSYPDSLTEYNGKLYFSAYGPGSALQELWVSDGTDAGTTLIQINPNPTSAEVSNLIVYNNELYFSANAGGGLGKELYAYMDPALAANDFQLTGNAIKLYPNPTKSHFELATTANVEKVEVYSLQGQLVKTFANQNQYEINDLAKGMYIVKISAQEGVANKTLVIE